MGTLLVVMFLLVPFFCTSTRHPNGCVRHLCSLSALVIRNSAPADRAEPGPEQ